jgi:hypothetical protein
MIGTANCAHRFDESRHSFKRLIEERESEDA